MPTPEAEIWLALKAKLATLLLPAGWPVFEPDAAIERPSDALGPLPYVLVSDVRNEHQRVGLAKKKDGRVSHIRSGTLMLALHYPVARPASHAQLTEMGGMLAGHFLADQRMRYGGTCLRVVQDADADQPYREGVERVVIVRVRWTTV